MEWHRQMFVGAGIAIACVTARFRSRVPVENGNLKRLTIVQFGDYAEGFQRLATGGEETFFAQKYSVDAITAIAKQPEVLCTTVIHLSSDRPRTVLPNGVTSMGLRLFVEGKVARHSELLCEVANTNPTHLILMSPQSPVILWAICSRTKLLPMFADSFRTTGLKTWIQNKILSFLLNNHAIEVVANHNMAASLDLQRIGVDPCKIVPFDWPPLISRHKFGPKERHRERRSFKAIYVGSVIESKGIGDAIEALSILHSQGQDVQLSVVGSGEIHVFQQLAAKLGVSDKVVFLGRRPHGEVLTLMRDHDAVLVPSHWSYPEGIPMTIYEAFCTGTPVLVSDHPMFSLKVEDRKNGIVVPEKSPAAIAEAISSLKADPRLYAEISQGGQAAADIFLCPLKYHELIEQFVSADDLNEIKGLSISKIKNSKMLQEQNPTTGN